MASAHTRADDDDADDNTDEEIDDDEDGESFGGRVSVEACCE